MKIELQLRGPRDDSRTDNHTVMVQATVEEGDMVSVGSQYNKEFEVEELAAFSFEEEAGSFGDTELSEEEADAEALAEEEAEADAAADEAIENEGSPSADEDGLDEEEAINLDGFEDDGGAVAADEEESDEEARE